MPLDCQGGNAAGQIENRYSVMSIEDTMRVMRRDCTLHPTDAAVTQPRWPVVVLAAAHRENSGSRPDAGNAQWPEFQQTCCVRRKWRGMGLREPWHARL